MAVWHAGCFPSSCPPWLSHVSDLSDREPPNPPGRNTSHIQSTCYFSRTQGGRVSLIFFVFFHLFHETGVRLQTWMHNKSQSQKTSCLITWPPWGFDHTWDPSCQRERHNILAATFPEINNSLNMSAFLIHFLFHNCFGLLTNLCISPVAVFKYVIDQNI